MQQVQTSQPVVTWTFMKAIFTGTIRSVASCPPASRIREPGVFCRHHVVDAANSIRVFGGWTLQTQMGPISVMSYEASQIGDHAHSRKPSQPQWSPNP